MFSNRKLYSSYSLKENEIYEDKPCYISCLGTDFFKSGRLFLRDCTENDLNFDRLQGQHLSLVYLTNSCSKTAFTGVGVAVRPTDGIIDGRACIRAS